LSQPSNDVPRIIPLADAPSFESSQDSPAATSAGPSAPSAGAFERDPLNSLKYQSQIVEAISKVFDPEIPVNIYELGLIYNMDVDSASNVYIRMTLTAPGCPSAQQIPLDVERPSGPRHAVPLSCLRRHRSSSFACYLHEFHEAFSSRRERAPGFLNDANISGECRVLYRS